MEDKRPWKGVDLDGTLAYYDHWRGIEHIGEPIPEMYCRVKSWISQGIRVKIFTARCCRDGAIFFIEQWLLDHNLPITEITNIKDFQCDEIWDDRAVSVLLNTGKPSTVAMPVPYAKIHKDPD